LTVAFLALIEIELHFPENGDLKGKRKELKSLMSQLQRGGAAIAETDHHDLWQRASLLAVVVGREKQAAESRADAVRHTVDRRYPDGSTTSVRILSTGDVLP
jgi:uncharacterized protein YlxP (DUF503 family)